MSKNLSIKQTKRAIKSTVKSKSFLVTIISSLGTLVMMVGAAYLGLALSDKALKTVEKASPNNEDSFGY